MEWLSTVLGRPLSDPSHWYSVTAKDFHGNFGRSLLLKYKGSPYEVLRTIFPNLEWLPWKFDVTPKGYWKDKANQRRYLDWLGVQLGFNSRDDYYKIHERDIRSYFGGSLLEKYYQGSPTALVMGVYDDYPFLTWRFSQVPVGFWKSKENQIAYVKWLQDSVGVGSIYELTWSHFLSNGGRTMLAQIKGSLAEYLQELMANAPSSSSPSISQLGNGSNAVLKKTPNVAVPKNHWASLENQRAFMRDLASRLGFDSARESSRWYSLTTKELLSHGGAGILRHYNDSIPKLLKGVFPGIDWLPWRFERLPRNFLRNLSEEEVDGLLKRVAEEIMHELKLRSVDDFNRVTAHQLEELHLNYLLNRFGGLQSVLQRVRSKYSSLHSMSL